MKQEIIVDFIGEKGDIKRSDLIERFNLTRSEAWRLLERLRKLGLVETYGAGVHSRHRLRVKG